MDSKKMNVRQATEKWIKEGFEAVPYDIIQYAFINSRYDYMEVLTGDESGRRLSHDNFPIAIKDFYLVNNQLDRDWIIKNIRTLEACGFIVYASRKHMFIAIDGLGYDLIDGHWIHLYLHRGLDWHNN